MEESIKIQEEFENLIEQLEKLRNINELTFANTESARKVIQQIDSFIIGINNYQQKVEENNDRLSLSIQKLIDSLRDSINSVENQKDSVLTSIQNQFLVIQKLSKLDLEAHTTEIRSISDKTFKFIENRTKELSKSIESALEKMESEMKDFKDKTGESITYVNQNVAKQIELSQKSFESFKMILDEKINKTETNLMNSYTTLVNSLKNNVNENRIDVLKKLETQEQEIKSLKTLLFVISGLIVIGIVATMLK